MTRNVFKREALIVNDKNIKYSLIRHQTKQPISDKDIFALFLSAPNGIKMFWGISGSLQTSEQPEDIFWRNVTFEDKSWNKLIWATERRIFVLTCWDVFLTG